MTPGTLAALRKALRRGVRRISPHVAPPQRRALHALAGDVELMLELASAAAAPAPRVCTLCGHPEAADGRGWCEQWTPIDGSAAELACCRSACSYG